MRNQSLSTLKHSNGHDSIRFQGKETKPSQPHCYTFNCKSKCQHIYEWAGLVLRQINRTEQGQPLPSVANRSVSISRFDMIQCIQPTMFKFVFHTLLERNLLFFKTLKVLLNNFKKNLETLIVSE